MKPDKEILQIYDIGSQLRNNFIAYRKTDAEPELCVWDTLTRRQLITFKNTSKKINIKGRRSDRKTKRRKRNDEEVVVISRTRPELDVAELFAKHEFTVVPRSLFDSQENCVNAKINHTSSPPWLTNLLHWIFQRIKTLGLLTVWVSSTS